MEVARISEQAPNTWNGHADDGIARITRCSMLELLCSYPEAQIRGVVFCILELEVCGCQITRLL